ncbi:MAG TPA: LamG-like jellyroll fold domain-containing protein, partial [Nannocystaceae bacterium]|nr:LamG-like jellyroll fold domain-containing protein [Nannocystaceae bacterium]
IAKIDDAFYVGFHGFDGVRGYRGLARTPDLDVWEPLRQLFGPADCAGWNVPWLPGGCIGGGAASTAIEAPWTYMLIEAADISLGCTDNQHWVFGMLRTNDLVAGVWEPLPAGPGLLFGTHEPKSNGATPPCSVQYTRIFRDDDGTIWLALSKSAVLDDIDADPVAGRYLYRLERDAPIADYPFRIGPNRTYVASEAISRGDLELGIVGSTWMPAPDPETYALTLGPGAALAGVDAAALDLRDDFSLQLDVRIDSLPMNGTSLLAGKILQYWIELYIDGELCGWVMLPAGPSPVCAQIDDDLGAWHHFAFEREGTKLRLVRDGAMLAEADISAEPLVPALDVFRVSNQAPNIDGFYGPIDGMIDRITLFDHVP